MISLICFIVLIIVFSFLCSMTEAAILSVPLLRVRILLEQKRPGALDLLYVKDNIALAVAALVIVNNSVNILGSMFIGQQVYLRYGSHWLGLVSGVLTFLIVVLGEVIPKAIGERFKIPVALTIAKVVRVLTEALQPFVTGATSLLKLWGPDSRVSRVTEEEIKMMLQIGRDAGTVETDEAELCNKVFRLKDLKAGQIMKPLREAYMLPLAKTLADVKDKIISAPYNRILVYDQTSTQIVGIVQQRVLLREIAKDNVDSKISKWMLKPIFVNHIMKLDALMEKFQTFHQHLFIVRDSAGKNVGLVTMEDVLEELFGEIYDEKDVRSKELSKGKTPVV
ncbi:MAG: hemolysin family protein [Candidatus Omnitrophota bacterium]